MGFPGGTVVGGVESVSLAAGAVALLVARVAPAVGQWGLGLLLLAAVHRLAGGQGLGLLALRRPSWTVLLHPPGPATRLVLFATLDRARPALLLRQVAAAGIALALFTAAWEAWTVALPLAGALAFGAAAMHLSARTAPLADAPEAAAAAALVGLAGRLPPRPEVAILVTGSGAADGAGVLAALDWYAVPRGEAELWWITGAPGARSGILRKARGWQRLPPAARAVCDATPGVASLVAAGWSVERLGLPPAREATPPDDMVAALLADVQSGVGAARSVG